MKQITDQHLYNIVKKVIKEEQEESLMKRLVRKLKGVSDVQLEYNMKNKLPWDWKGTKEGYHEHITNKKHSSGSN